MAEKARLGSDTSPVSFGLFQYWYPDAPAAAYLLAIQHRPKEVMEALAEQTA